MWIPWKPDQGLDVQNSRRQEVGVETAPCVDLLRLGSPMRRRSIGFRRRNPIAWCCSPLALGFRSVEAYNLRDYDDDDNDDNDDDNDEDDEEDEDDDDLQKQKQKPKKCCLNWKRLHSIRLSIKSQSLFAAAAAVTTTGHGVSKGVVR